MKSKKWMFAVALLMLACSKKGGIPVGTSVAAMWGGSTWYQAKVTAAEGNRYHVTYSDNSAGTVDAEGIKVIPSDPVLQTGNKVMAIWGPTGKFYPGEVQEVKSEGFMVKWDDGSEPSLVAKGSLFKN